MAFVRGIQRWPVNSPHKGPVPPKMFLFDDVIMEYLLVNFETNKNNWLKRKCISECLQNDRHIIQASAS